MQPHLYKCRELSYIKCRRITRERGTKRTLLSSFLSALPIITLFLSLFSLLVVITLCVRVFLAIEGETERERLIVELEMGKGVECGFFSCCVHRLFLVLLVAVVVRVTGKGGWGWEQCDLFTGRWVVDSTYPLYQPATCPFIEREFRCEANGRPDLIYTHYRWQPLSCNLLRFNGRDFLEMMRGKSIMFVGDSLSRNQWQSLTCLLHSAVPNSNYTLARVGDVSIFTFTEYKVKVMLDRNVYLVDVVREDIGRVLKLDSMEGSKLWKGVDMLIFNTWHWWYRRGPTQPWDYIQVGSQVMKDMDRMKAFEKALTTWAAWVDTNIDPTKVKVFFQGISPSHYNGSLWNEPSARSCIQQKTPVAGSTYPGGLPPAVAVLKSVLSTIKKPITLLDITTLSLLRKDGHPSIYGLFGSKGMDCSHWCLSGVPDTWNEILYNLI